MPGIKLLPFLLQGLERFAYLAGAQPQDQEAHLVAGYGEDRRVYFRPQGLEVKVFHHPYHGAELAFIAQVYLFAQRGGG
jgi:hypothetical protein